jgi:D-serine/D-alanine/glycine transporter
MLFGLGSSRNAPGGLARLSTRHVPSRAVLTVAIAGLAVALLLHFVPSAAAAYQLMAAMSSPVFLIVWGIIVVTYIRYCLTRKNEHSASKFKAPGGIMAGFGVLAMLVFCYLLGMLEPAGTLGSICAIVFFAVIQLAYSLRRRLATAREGS